MTQQFWSAQYASANTATSSFATKYMADVPDVDVKMHARMGATNMEVIYSNEQQE